MSLWRWWREVRFAGSCGRPASSPIETGVYGGRAVVVPIVFSSIPVAFA